MDLFLEIKDVKGLEILDSRGNPTVEAQVTVYSHLDGRSYQGTGKVPSGASTGRFEAVELRDGEKRYRGLGVAHAVKNIKEKLSTLLIGENALDQRGLDKKMIEADGTENKGNLGANAILAVSQAIARAASKALHMPLYRYLGGTNSYRMPVPMMNILNGGRHAENTVDFQEFMIMPVKADCFTDGLRICAEIYHVLKEILKRENYGVAVGDEGGFAPNLPDAVSVLEYIVKAIEEAGYQAGEDILIALDVAASELYDEEKGTYYFPGESKLHGTSILRDTNEMITYYESLLERFPITSIEDGLAEDDWEGWKQMTLRIGEKVQLVGDDLFVTNVKRLEAGIKLEVANAILVKINQIGTVTEAMEAVEMAKRNGYHSIISHRSGETEDTFIADLAVAVNSGQIKTGAPCRSDRVAKYNRLLCIESELGEAAQYYYHCI